MWPFTQSNGGFFREWRLLKKGTAVLKVQGRSEFGSALLMAQSADLKSGCTFVGRQEWRMARNSTGRQQEAQWKLMLQGSPVRMA